MYISNINSDGIIVITHVNNKKLSIYKNKELCSNLSLNCYNELINNHETISINNTIANYKKDIKLAYFKLNKNCIFS